MNPSTFHSFRGLRLCLNAGFILLLVCASYARAVPVEWGTGKALQQSITELKSAANGLFSDPPESKAAVPQLSESIHSPLPRVLGRAHEQQFNAMVHQLRDRLMHAPPAPL